MGCVKHDVTSCGICSEKGRRSNLVSLQRKPGGLNNSCTDSINDNPRICFTRSMRFGSLRFASVDAACEYRVQCTLANGSMRAQSPMHTCKRQQLRCPGCHAVCSAPRDSQDRTTGDLCRLSRSRPAICATNNVSVSVVVFINSQSSVRRARTMTTEQR